MKVRENKIWGILVVLAAVAALGACHKKAVPPQPGFSPESSYSGAPGAGTGMDDARWRELGINSEAEKREFLDRVQSFENQDVYFDYDAYTLTPPAKKVLDEKAAFLKRYSRVKVTVEGHCDERGTTEYNIALGERRANSAMQYLSGSGGLSAANLSNVSYGKEKPIATGHDEASWAKNRRAHFVVKY